MSPYLHGCTDDHGTRTSSTRSWTKAPTSSLRRQAGWHTRKCGRDAPNVCVDSGCSANVKGTKAPVLPRHSSNQVWFPKFLKNKNKNTTLVTSPTLTQQHLHAATSHERDSAHVCAPRNATRRPPPATNHPPTAARSLPSPALAR